MATPLLGGDVTVVQFRLSPDSYFKTTFRYRVKNDGGGFTYEDFPVGSAIEIRFPNPDGVTPDLVYAADSIVGQYAKFNIPDDDVNDVLATNAVKGQVWFDDTTGFELVASGPIVLKD